MRKLTKTCDQLVPGISGRRIVEQHKAPIDLLYSVGHEVQKRTNPDIDAPTAPAVRELESTAKAIMDLQRMRKEINRSL